VIFVVNVSATKWSQTITVEFFFVLGCFYFLMHLFHKAFQLFLLCNITSKNFEKCTFNFYQAIVNHESFTFHQPIHENLLLNSF